jgi:hypothetical protein
MVKIKGEKSKRTSEDLKGFDGSNPPLSGNESRPLRIIRI